MKKLNEAVERFCALHPRLGIPGLMRYIVGANAVIYLLSLFARGGSLNFLCMDPASVLRGELWRIVTYVLLPTNGGIFLVISLFFYYWLGESLERLWGSTKFTVYYVSGTLLTALASLLAYLIDGISVPVYGAVYVNTALFLAFALNYPDAMVNIYFIIPVKMKWLAALEGILYALSVVTAIAARMWGQALMPIVALLNLFVFFTPDFLRKADRVKAHTRPQAVQFRRAVKEQQRQKGYHHKCSVCGRTDTDYPDLQFRYCSKCAGYHCFCEDHIFNHTHFTE
ncbi:MAG: rhomboid family intramembrane serine protease [Oscillospiraceae bacterium]|nr:rhomboid family intramembrane serine protease [Oscillospiraceae bacterium]